MSQSRSWSSPTRLLAPRSSLRPKRRRAIPIPPTYLDDTPERQRLRERLEQAAQDSKQRHAGGIAKLLAVLSGLGRFGRNNICYVGRLGQLRQSQGLLHRHSLCGRSYPIRFMDAYQGCDLCRQNCPTGAIGAKTAIDAGRCLTLHNESDQPCRTGCRRMSTTP